MEFKSKTFADMYHKIAWALVNEPEYISSPRGLAIKEIMNAQLVIEDPSMCTFKNLERDVPSKYLANELCLYLMGANDAQRFAKASPFWDTIKNHDDTVNSAYGNLLFCHHKEDHCGYSQFEWAKMSLIKDKDTRQAILHFNRTYHQSPVAKDFTCTMYGNFHIRDNKLNFKISMRSNDVFFGVTFDIPFFCILQNMMLDALKDAYPDLELGTYTHCADSLHLYEKDFETVEKMLEYEFIPDTIPMPTSKMILAPMLHNMYDSRVYDGNELCDQDHKAMTWLYTHM